MTKTKGNSVDTEGSRSEQAYQTWHKRTNIC